MIKTSSKRTALKKMPRKEATTVLENFVPLGHERKYGDQIAEGCISVDLSKKLPENLSLAQVWAQNVVLNHAEVLEELGTTKQGFFPYRYGNKSRTCTARTPR